MSGAVLFFVLLLAAILVIAMSASLYFTLRGRRARRRDPESER